MAIYLRYFWPIQSKNISPLFLSVHGHLLPILLLIRAKIFFLPDSHHQHQTQASFCSSFSASLIILADPRINRSPHHLSLLDLSSPPLSLSASLRPVTITIFGFSLVDRAAPPFLSFSPASGQLQHDHLSSRFPVLICCSCWDRRNEGRCWWPGVDD